MKFSEKIIQARKAKALTQEDLAEAVGVSRQAVSKWETGEAKPDLEKLMGICRVLELSMDYLCLDKEPQPAPEPQPVEPAKKNGTRYLIAGVCIGLVVAILAGLLAMALTEEENYPTVTEPFQTSTSTTVPPETEPDYAPMLVNLKTANAKWELVGWHVNRITFVPSIQVPGMQVQIAARNHKTGSTEYCDTIRQGTAYIIDYTTPNAAFDLEYIAICSVGEVSVQFSLFSVVSDDGNDFNMKKLWKTE